MNRTIYFSTLMIILIASLSSIVAAASTISGGYAQSNIQGIMNKANGLNLKYSHEQNNNSLGIISSFTYSEGNFFENNIYNKGQYYGITSGPTFRINNWVNIYGVVGIGYGKFQQIVDQGKTHTINDNYGFSYGTGFQINLIKNIVLDISYERSSISSVNVNSWIAGIGYHF